MNSKKGQEKIAIILAIAGVMLMVGKIYADSEPGLLPLVLTAVGAGWYLVIRLRARRNRD